VSPSDFVRECSGLVQSFSRLVRELTATLRTLGDIAREYRAAEEAPKRSPLDASPLPTEAEIEAYAKEAPEWERMNELCSQPPASESGPEPESVASPAESA
jgi:hypothetical protein